MIWLGWRNGVHQSILLLSSLSVWHCIQGKLIAQRYPTLTPHWTTCLGQFNLFTGERELHQLTFTFSRWIPTFNLHSEVHFYFLHRRKHFWLQARRFLNYSLWYPCWFLLRDPGDGHSSLTDWWSRFDLNISGLHFTVRDPTLSASHSGMTRQHLATTILRAEPLDYEASTSSCGVLPGLCSVPFDVIRKTELKTRRLL